MKKIKRLLVLAISLCMTFGIFITPVNAEETSTEDIMNYVFGGSGTEIDSYVLADALNIDQGVLEISYRAYYNSSRFYTSCIDVWHTAGTAVVGVPALYHGIGS